MKTVVITGANAGIGFATARWLAAHPDWHVILACRDAGKATAAMALIRRAHTDAHVDYVPPDLLSLDSVRRVPDELSAMQLPLS